MSTNKANVEICVDPQTNNPLKSYTKNACSDDVCEIFTNLEAQGLPLTDGQFYLQTERLEKLIAGEIPDELYIWGILDKCARMSNKKLAQYHHDKNSIATQRAADREAQR